MSEQIAALNEEVGRLRLLLDALAIEEGTAYGQGFAAGYQAAALAVESNPPSRGTPSVLVHPGMKFGYPSIEGHRIDTRMVAEHSSTLGGESAMDTWDLTRDEVMVACWFEARYGTRGLKRLWREWLERYEKTLWHSHEKAWAAVPFPPRKT